MEFCILKSAQWDWSCQYSIFSQAVHLKDICGHKTDYIFEVLIIEFKIRNTL